MAGKKVKYAIFRLSMPNVGSWNGQWSGANSHYSVARQVTSANKEHLKDDASHYYNFGDGWGASVRVKLVEGAREKAAAVKGSAGFCGYDWMVDSICRCGSIKSE